MIPVERQRTILRMLEQQGTATIPELVDTLGVSHMTVRRDVATLEQAGRVSSVTGGVALPSRLNLDLAHAAKAEMHQDEKRAIGTLAATLVSTGDVVFLDAGTTTLAVAEALADRDGLVFVTNDLVVARVLADRSANELHLASGVIDRANLAAEGRETADAIARFNIDVAYLSTSAFDLRGTSIQSEAKRVVKESIVHNADRTFLVTDSSKYGRVMPLKSVAIDRLEGVVTDARLSESARTSIEEAGVRVLVARNTSGRN